MFTNFLKVPYILFLYINTSISLHEAFSSFLSHSSYLALPSINMNWSQQESFIIPAPILPHLLTTSRFRTSREASLRQECHQSVFYSAKVQVWGQEPSVLHGCQANSLEMEIGIHTVRLPCGTQGDTDSKTKQQTKGNPDFETEESGLWIYDVIMAEQVLRPLKGFVKNWI